MIKDMENHISQVILDFYKGYPGSFLDVGSGHPVVGNITHPLEKSGWSGLCVEPRTNHNDEYKSLRPNSVVENYAVVGSDYYDEYIKAYVNQDYSLYNVTGLNVTNTEDFIFWPVTTLGSLLKKYQIRTIDLFNLNVMGYEKEVLQGVDFNFTKFGMILINLHTWEKACNDFSFLKDHGYLYLTMLSDQHELWVNDVLPIIKRQPPRSNL